MAYWFNMIGRRFELAMLAAMALAACASAESPVEHADAAPASEEWTMTPEESAAFERALEGLPHGAAMPLTQNQLATYPDARDMPADVQHFVVQWQDCAHWLGEPPYDAARARQIEQAVADVCPGVDARGAAVRARHAGSGEVLARIASYQPLGQ